VACGLAASCGQDIRHALFIRNKRNDQVSLHIGWCRLRFAHPQSLTQDQDDKKTKPGSAGQLIERCHQILQSSRAIKQINRRELLAAYVPHFAPPLAFQLKHPHTPVAPVAVTLMVL
jgi:hypothetical protein